jgi:hypothetical protein
VRLIPLVIVATLAVGYTLGRLHAADHVADWCYDLATGSHKPHSLGWAVAETAAPLLVAVALILRPRRTWQAIRDASLPVYIGVAWGLILIGAGVLAVVKVVA